VWGGTGLVHYPKSVALGAAWPRLRHRTLFSACQSSMSVMCECVRMLVPSPPPPSMCRKRNGAVPSQRFPKLRAACLITQPLTVQQTATSGLLCPHALPVSKEVMRAKGLARILISTRVHDSPPSFVFVCIFFESSAAPLAARDESDDLSTGGPAHPWPGMRSMMYSWFSWAFSLIYSRGASPRAWR
jgi:hypothetical protein